MEVAILSHDRRKDWDQFINEHPHSIAWQSYGWSDVLKNHYQVKFYPLAACENEEICGILPLYHLRTGLPRAKDMLISVPHAVAGGILADDDPVKQLLIDKAIEISLSYHNCSIAFKQYKIKNNAPLRTDENYYNRELDLTDSLDNLWNALADVNKQNITAAEKHNSRLEIPSPDIDTFYNLLFRHHHRRGIPCVSKKWIADLIAFDMYSIAFLKNQNAIVAATLVKEFKTTVSFPFTCVPDASDTSLMFAYTLYWNLIKRFASQGKEIFHSGRIPQNDNTDAYRLGWGGTKHPYYYQYHPPCTTSTEYSKKRGRKRHVLESCWKKMPDPLARWLGPHVVRQFP